MKKLILLASILFLSTVAQSYPYIPKTDIKLNNFNAVHGVPILIYSDNYDQVENYSANLITIQAQYNIYIDGCGYDPHHWNVNVAPGTSWHNHWQPMKECTFASPGKYQIRAEAIVDGASVDFHNEKIAYGVVTVS
jgi:hypothetical protein